MESLKKLIEDQRRDIDGGNHQDFQYFRRPLVSITLLDTIKIKEAKKRASRILYMLGWEPRTIAEIIPSSKYATQMSKNRHYYFITPGNNAIEKAIFTLRVNGFRYAQIRKALDIGHIKVARTLAKYGLTNKELYLLPKKMEE